MTVTEVTDRVYGSGCLGWPRPHAPSELTGRDQDLSVIQEFVARVPARGGTLLLSGAPGVGASALLDSAEEVAATAGLRVLRAAGAEFEDESFSALNQLLLPLRGELDRLGDPFRSALSVALGFGDGPAREPIVVSNAVLALLQAVAADCPLLLIVDHVHWADRASTRALGFVGRRLSGSSIGLLAAQRPGGLAPFGLDVARHEVQPLDQDASARLVGARFPELATGARRRIVAEAQGNPLALLELPVALTAAQRAGLAPLPAVLPLSSRLRARWSPAISALPAPVAYLLLLAALDGTGSLSLLRAAAGGEYDLDDLAAAEQAGLVRVDEATGRVEFAHPLIRSAVQDRSASGDVRRAHRALAGQLRDQPERLVWHLAAAAIEPDGVIAGQLERAAGRLRDRGDAHQAVTALLRAAQLSPPDRDPTRLQAEAAALSATVTGELPLARRLLADARLAASRPAGSLGPEGSLHAAVADASLLLNGGADIDTVHRLLADAVETWPTAVPGAGTARTATLQALLAVCVVGGRPELWEPFDAALARLGPGERDDLDLLAATCADPARLPAGTLGRLDAAIAGLPGETTHQRTLLLGAAAAGTDRLAGCREALRRVARDAREGGAALTAIGALTLLCQDGFLTGAWDEASQLGLDCLQACQSHGHQAGAWLAREQLAMIAAARGDHELVAELTGEMLRWAMPRGATLARMAAHRVGALAACGRGDFAEAYREAAAISPPGILAAHAPHALWASLDLVEAAVRTGRQQEASAHVAAVRAAGLADISPRLELLVTAAAAIAAPVEQAGRLYQRALGTGTADRWPFEFARVQLGYGEHLRRVRATSDARVPLGAALAAFRALGARPWADRAANELRAGGLTVVKTESFLPPGLTAQERQIASLAAAGLTNKQIGQRLYLSPRTVSNHLYKVFPKLGISSRAGLRDALMMRTPDDSVRPASALSRSRRRPAPA
jgi:DNA-binding CsgD family transcriptional regulator